ncbi:efflux RND transporter periplasmic adaptor subunit [Nodosilinea nodulosa]|uniref:efflux RND transporter periplasmic adaptor subunit n=1 Tax=Nodosilinea nodulosa TaxID=416001 RepID=UPI000317CAFB|nr:efflux RND transporter periplasmic adaptor subunit [Nodosilinea nodulosa]
MTTNPYSRPLRQQEEAIPPPPPSKSPIPLPPKFKGRSLIWGVSLVGLLGLLGLLGPRLLPLLPHKSQDLSLEELTQPVEVRSLTVRVEGSGSVVAKDTVNLSPKTAGRVAALYGEQGDQVKTGQVVAQMEVGTLTDELQQDQAQLAQANADYAKVVAGNRDEEIRRARAEVAAATSQVTLTASQLERYQALADRGAISQNDLDQYSNEARNAQASLTQAQAQLEETTSGSRPEDIAAAAAAVAAAEAKVAATQTQIEEATIRAPFDGVITQTYATVGAIVTPTTSASATASATSSSILAISSGLDITIDVSEASIAQIRAGQSVDIVADAFPQQVFKGRVKRIPPEAVTEDNVTVFQVVVEPLSGLDQLKAGMTVDATFTGETLANALVVPTVAIATENGELGVRVADPAGKPVFKPVTVGFTQDGKTQIVSGLAAGDRIFLDLPPTEGGASFAPPSPLP